MFIHLHWHSHYSLLEWVWQPANISNKAKELWMNAIAITDNSAMYWAIEFYKKAWSDKFKPIIWVELSIVNNISQKDINEKIYNIVLLVKNYEWYQNLMKIVSIANLKWFHNVARIDMWILQENIGWLIWFMWWQNSQIWEMINSWDNNSKIIEKLTQYKKIFWDGNFYLEIIAQDYNKEKLLQKINNSILALSKESQIPLIVNNNYCYINSSDKEAYEVLLCIKDWWYINSWDKKIIKWDYHIFSEDEIRSVLDKNGFEKTLVDEMIANNCKIAEFIELKIPLYQLLFPKYESPEYIKKLYEQHKDWLEI